MGHLHRSMFDIPVHNRSWTLNYSQAYSEAKKWRYTPFPHYNEFQALVEGRHATGEHAFWVSLASNSDDENSDVTAIKHVEDTDDELVTSQ